ncbi:MAG: c-type cytochrome [Gammaproteobacteria bacterium]|nr:c-type cytochrome [Gammaproteobacteria bacterium]
MWFFAFFIIVFNTFPANTFPVGPSPTSQPFHLSLLNLIPAANAATGVNGVSRSDWLLPKVAPSPENNKMDKKKAELGKMLFFDPRLSGDGRTSCATCHDPALGWSDGLTTATGHNGIRLPRATLSIVNVGFNKILMWDGRNIQLEEQAIEPIFNPVEMNNTEQNLLKTLRSIPGYVKAFKEAYWGLGVSSNRVARSLAMYQRQVVSVNSPFAKWIRGNESAMTESQKRGFEVFIDTNRGNCITCHRPPNFMDNGFHNIGLLSFKNKKPDLGRFSQKKVNMTKGAFRTPTLWNIAETAPYFHDGSAKNLRQVLNHYISGGKTRTNLSPNMKVLRLKPEEQKDLIAFLNALTGEIDQKLTQFTLPR